MDKNWWVRGEWMINMNITSGIRNGLMRWEEKRRESSKKMRVRRDSSIWGENGWKVGKAQAICGSFCVFSASKSFRQRVALFAGNCSAQNESNRMQNELRLRQNCFQIKMDSHLHHPKIRQLFESEKSISKYSFLNNGRKLLQQPRCSCRMMQSILNNQISSGCDRRVNKSHYNEVII